MDIEIELEILIDKHKGKQVGLGEIRLDWFAEDCLKEIRRLKSEIARQSAEREEVHLCNDCKYGCIAACPITKNVKFGNGLGNDNVIECENYINKEALEKWRINKIITGGLSDGY